MAIIFVPIIVILMVSAPFIGVILIMIYAILAVFIIAFGTL